jgi:hypothetical protein
MKLRWKRFSAVANNAIITIMGRVASVVLLFTLTLAAAAQSSVATLTLTTKPTPLGLGQNLFEVTVTDAKRQAVTNAEVTILLLMPADPKTKHPEMRTEGTLNNIGGGKYTGIAIVSMAGDWDVTVTATRNGKQIAQKKQKLTAHMTRPTPKK